ncbi:MAG: FKBP-type peptidyl-prolyl cis-trans isomerase [Verrucomicrobiales bacterium]|nr:FKBP-type peptidyl-prolyl cis-trans isomerase [Verrucomicrobiales bacterium]
MAETRAADNEALTDPAKKFSYSLGMSLGNNLKRSFVDLGDVDVELLAQGLKDSAAGTMRLNDTEARNAIMAFQTEARNQIAGKNKTAAEDFLAANQTKPGIVTTPSGLQYKVLAEGAGDSPAATDNVSVHYRGTLLDGTEFDSSYARNQPATFGVGQVIKGWTEALQLMRPGAKWQLFIKPDLAYGESGRPGIPPNALLTFDVELLSIQSAPAPAAPAQPVTSDIIKVPSKEELDKGAKIEVIKAADLEKYKQQEAEKAKTDKKE